MNDLCFTALQWPGHVSASLECLISSKEAKWGAKALEAAGFDTQGRLRGVGLGMAARQLQLPACHG